MAHDESEALKKMTDQLMFEKWSELLRPLFSQQADFSFKPRRRSMCICWTQDGDPRDFRSVAIVFTKLAWKGYRGARSVRRSRADQHLEALVRSHLRQFDRLHRETYHKGCYDTGSYDTRSGELQISVASVDIFPPPAGMSASMGETLSAG